MKGDSVIPPLKPNRAVTTDDRGRPSSSAKQTVKKTTLTPKPSGPISGSRFSVLVDRDEMRADLETVNTKEITEEEVMGDQGVRGQATVEILSIGDGSEEMEDVAVGVSHKNLTAGLTNLNRVSSVFVGQASTSKPSPAKNQNGPLKDITNSTYNRTSKLKFNRIRLVVNRGPYVKEVSSLKQPSVVCVNMSQATTFIDN